MSLGHHSFIYADLVDLLNMVFLANLTAVELSVCTGKLGCGQPILMTVLRSGIVFLAVMYSAAISASAADAITFLMICTIVNTGQLSFGLG